MAKSRDRSFRRLDLIKINKAWKTRYGTPWGEVHSSINSNVSVISMRIEDSEDSLVKHFYLHNGNVMIHHAPTTDRFISWLKTYKGAIVFKYIDDKHVPIAIDEISNEV